MQITIQVNNYAAVKRALSAIGSNIPTVIKKSTMRMANEAVRLARIYPPPPEGSKYIRTYKFKNAWRVTPSGVLGTRIFNDANQKGRMYPVFVMGDDMGQGQAQIHVGRWTLILNNVKKETERMDTFIEQEIRDLIKSNKL